MIAANPCFGLDFAAVAQIHAEIMAARNRGAAVLLVSEELDELLELAGIVVIFHGQFVYETRGSEADLRNWTAHGRTLGPAMSSNPRSLRSELIAPRWAQSRGHCRSAAKTCCWCRIRWWSATAAAALGPVQRRQR
jgi:ABC-type multidrug transport system ATPase subunit